MPNTSEFDQLIPYKPDPINWGWIAEMAEHGQQRRDKGLAMLNSIDGLTVPGGHSTQQASQELQQEIDTKKNELHKKLEQNPENALQIGYEAQSYGQRLQSDPRVKGILADYAISPEISKEVTSQEFPSTVQNYYDNKENKFHQIPLNQLSQGFDPSTYYQGVKPGNVKELEPYLAQIKEQVTSQVQPGQSAVVDGNGVTHIIDDKTQQIVKTITKDEVERMAYNLASSDPNFRSLQVFNYAKAVHDRDFRNPQIASGIHPENASQFNEGDMADILANSYFGYRKEEFNKSSEKFVPQNKNSGSGQKQESGVPFTPSDQTPVILGFSGSNPELPEYNTLAGLNSRVQIKQDLANKADPDRNGQFMFTQGSDGMIAYNKQELNRTVVGIMRDQQVSEEQAEQIYFNSGQNHNALYQEAKNNYTELQHQAELESNAQKQVVQDVVSDNPNFKKLAENGIVDLNTGQIDFQKYQGKGDQYQLWNSMLNRLYKEKYDIEQRLPEIKSSLAKMSSYKPGFIEKHFGYGEKAFLESEQNKLQERYSALNTDIKSTQNAMIENDPLLKDYYKKMDAKAEKYGTVVNEYSDSHGFPVTKDQHGKEWDSSENIYHNLANTIGNSGITGGLTKVINLSTGEELLHDKSFAEQLGMKDQDNNKSKDINLTEAEFVPRTYSYTSKRGIMLLGYYKVKDGQKEYTSNEVGLDPTGKQEEDAMKVLYQEVISQDQGVKIIQGALGTDDRPREEKLPESILSGTEVTVERQPNKMYRIQVKDPRNPKEYQELPNLSLSQAGQSLSNLRNRLDEVYKDSLLKILAPQESNNQQNANNPYSSAVGRNQVLFNGNYNLIQDTAKKMGMTPPSTKEEFAQNTQLYNTISNQLANSARGYAMNVKNQYPEFSTLQLASGFYYLGAEGMMNWLKVYKDNNKNSKLADNTIPGYNQGHNSSLLNYMNQAVLSAKKQNIQY